MSEHFLSTMDDGIKPLSGGDKYQVMIHIDAKLLDKASETHAWLEDGPGICIETARRLACDKIVWADIRSCNIGIYAVHGEK